MGVESPGRAGCKRRRSIKTLRDRHVENLQHTLNQIFNIESLGRDWHSVGSASACSGRRFAGKWQVFASGLAQTGLNRRYDPECATAYVRFASAVISTELLGSRLRGSDDIVHDHLVKSVKIHIYQIYNKFPLGSPRLPSAHLGCSSDAPWLALARGGSAVGSPWLTLARLGIAFGANRRCRSSSRAIAC